MSAIMLRKSTGATYTLPVASIAGDDPRTDYGGRGGDVIHERNGLKVSVRSFSNIHTWDFVLHGLDSTALASLRTYFSDRVLDFQPTGSVLLQYPVLWVNEFKPEFESIGKYSLSVQLEQTGS